MQNKQIVEYKASVFDIMSCISAEGLKTGTGCDFAAPIKKYSAVCHQFLSFVPYDHPVCLLLLYWF